MRLPQNRKERIQVFVLIGIGSLLAIFALAQLVITPFVASRQKLKAALGEQEGKLAKAKKELLHAPAIKEEYDQVSSELSSVIAVNVLHPILGSYLVGVTEMIENTARSVGFKTEEVLEVGVRELPTKKGVATARTFKSYTVQVTAEGSFRQAWTFADAFEKQNPFLCVTEIRITGRQDKPEQHRVILRIEWPIQTNPDGANDTSAERKGGSS
jgi:hypothetical protein